MVITQKEKTYGSQSCQKVVHGLALLYQNYSTIMKSNQEFLFKIKSCKSFFFLSPSIWCTDIKLY